jgi:putative DNA primase/helicase
MTGRSNGTTRANAGGARAGKAGIRAAVQGAAPLAPVAFEMPEGFEMRADGLWRVPGGDTKPFRICGPFEVAAESRPATGDEWGLLLRWRDRDGTQHEWIMPRRLLAGEAVAVRERLSACGLDVAATQGARQQLVNFLSAVRVARRVRTVARTGWHRQGESAAFVLPDETIGDAAGEVLRLDMDPPPTVYGARGTLDGWRLEVAAPCAGNTRLAFGVSLALGAALLFLLGDEGGGVNLRGESSKGKTTIIDAAASVWGPPSKTGPDAFVRPWRATSNALEQVAAAHNHALLPMDEMGQADPKELGETLYMLANGSGKERAKAGGGNRRNTTWTTVVLSSSEESAASLAAQSGRRIKAGQEVRLLDVPAVVPGGFGCFDTLHGEADGAAFAQRMRRAVVAQHGTAARAFVHHLAKAMRANGDFAAKVVERARAWVAEHVPREADGQVQRAANRIALAAVAGEMATEWGVTGWPAGEADRAAAVVFRDWLMERGGTGSREDHHLFAAMRRFIASHGTARFEVVRDPEADAEGAQVEPPLPDGPKTILRAGWRWQEADASGERHWIFGMVPEVFDDEIARQLGLEGKEARAGLGKAGFIRGHREGGELRWAFKAKRVPGVGRPRVMVIEPKLMDGAD